MTDVETAAPPPVVKKGINLALQGGGAHGAFTWGVLDYLLEDGRLAIEGISGASAGAINAVMVADGLARGGPEVARTRLADFWRAASIDGDLPVIQRRLIERLFTFVPLEGSPIQAWFDAISHSFSPYDLNPLNINPLKSLIERFVDFDAVRACTQLQLFVSATNVTTGRLRVFPREKITADAVMASACLPLLFKAVTIGRISRQPPDLSVVPRHQHRRRADRPDQSAAAQRGADLDPRHRQSRQRDQLQLPRSPRNTARWNSSPA